MRFNRILAAILFSTFVLGGLPAWAETAPFHPLCIRDVLFESPDFKTGSLTCDKSSDLVINPKTNWRKLDKDGFHTLSFSYNSINSDGGSISYKSLGKADGGIAVWAKYNSGGTGAFSRVAIIHTQDDQISANILASGDRCAGGIESAYVQQGKVVYNVYLSPPDILDLTVPCHGLKTSEDLESGAMSCAATAEYENQKLVAITLFDDPRSNYPEYNNHYTYQACFNAYYNQQIAKGVKRMALDQAKDFAKGFLNRCMPVRVND